MSPGRRLGRGLASLIPDDILGGDEAGERPVLRVVPIEEIDPNPDQPREVFAEAALRSLADSIRRHGLISPLVVRRHEGRYLLVAGERRLRAAALAGLAEVPVLVRDARAPAEPLELALVENLQRADLDPIEAARGYSRLVERYGRTQEEVAALVGRDRATVANAIRLLRGPAVVLAALREGRISAGHARALLPVTDEGTAGRMVREIVEGDLSVRETERRVARWVEGAPERGAEERAARAEALRPVGRLLSDSLQAAVAVRPRADGSGRIVIEYGDAEELDRLVEAIRGPSA